jgi:hypothetical protein
VHYNFKKLQELADNKDYVTNGFVKFKTLRYPVQNDQVHYILNAKNRIWEPILEQALSDFILFKQVSVEQLDALKIIYLYQKK